MQSRFQTAKQHLARPKYLFVNMYLHLAVAEIDKEAKIFKSLIVDFYSQFIGHILSSFSTILDSSTDLVALDQYLQLSFSKETKIMGH